MGFIRVSNHNLHYRFIKEKYYKPEKPVIVFLHEGLGSIPQWKDFPDQLCDKVQLQGLLYERYGYGQSDILKEKREKDYLVSEGLEVLPELVDKLNIKNDLILFGHSDGASIALAYASGFSDKICCLIAEAPHVFIEEISVKSIKKVIKAFENNALKSSLEKYHGNHTESMFYGWADAWTNKDYLDWNMEYLLAGITCPVLVIQGKDDEYGSDKQVFSIVDQVSGDVDYLLINECGHIPHLQKNELVMKHLVSFINKYL